MLFSLSLGLVFFGTVAQIHKETFTVVDEYFYSWVVMVPFDLFVDMGKVFLGFGPSARLPGSFPFPGGFLLGWALFFNLLAAHMVRFRMTWKRSGIILIHSGVVVLLMGEFITRKYAVEATMSIAEGERVNFVDVSRKVELTFLAPSEPGYDSVIAIPERMLTAKNTIRDAKLPVDVEVLEFASNSTFKSTNPDDPEGVTFTNTEGRNGRVLFEPAPEEAGTSSGRANAPLVRVRFKNKETGEDLGTYRLALWSYPNYTKRTFDFAPQTLKVGDVTCNVMLRPKRVYKPYTIELLKFEHKMYEGTSTPKDFASTINLSDPEWQEERNDVVSELLA